MLEGHNTGAEDYHKVLFSLLLLNRWFDSGRESAPCI